MRIPAMLSLLLLAACSVSAGGYSTPRGGIMGNYSATLAAGDFPATAPAEMRSQLAGPWMLAFHEGNHFVVSQNGSEVVQGHYEVNGDQISFGMGETGPYACNTPATYTWRVSGNQLTFALVGTDACDGRMMVLAARPFTRAP